MQNLVVVFDAERYDAAEIARLETEIWNGLKLSGELNRTKRDGKWVLHFNSEKSLREESFKKIKAFEAALEIKLREMTEGARGKRRTKGEETMDEPGDMIGAVAADDGDADAD